MSRRDELHQMFGRVFPILAMLTEGGLIIDERRNRLAYRPATIVRKVIPTIKEDMRMLGEHLFSETEDRSISLQFWFYVLGPKVVVTEEARKI